MIYWILTISLFIAIAVVGLILWKKYVKHKNISSDDFKDLIIIGCFLSVLFVPLAIDLPSALCGGREIYVNELPTRCVISKSLSYVKTDNKELKHLKLGNWERYEKYGNYRITYTIPIKFVLNIELIE